MNGIDPFLKTYREAMLAPTRHHAHGAAQLEVYRNPK